MRTLVIDCATGNCSAALFDHDDKNDDPRLVSGFCETLGRGHAERLVPMIGELPGRGRADRIAVSTGPGSFTGIRVGLAAAKALALGWNAKLLGFPTLALIAAQARGDHPGQPVGVANRAGHGEWFVAAFDADGMPLGEARSLSPEDAVNALETDLIAGSEAEALVALRGHGRALPIAPDARCFALLPQALLLEDPRPAYGRRPDAALPGQPRLSGQSRPSGVAGAA